MSALIALHELYTMSQQQQQKCGAGTLHADFEAHVAQFRKQLVACFALQRDFANSVRKGAKFRFKLIPKWIVQSNMIFIG